MGFWSAVGNFIDRAASTVRDVVSSAWRATKEVATNVVRWVAEKAEAVVTTVKKVWRSVAPYIAPVRHGLLVIAGHFPWVAGAAIVFERALHYLDRFSKSVWAIALDKAIEWAIIAAKHLKGKLTTKQEIDDAYQRQADLDNLLDQVPEDTRRAVGLVSLINNYKIIQTEIAKIFETNEISNIDHYLRLRATQKLLDNVEAIILTAESIDDISEDDIFLVKMGSALLSPNPDVTDPDFARLDAIIKRRYNKKLLPFVFEEMVIAWEKNRLALEKQWEEASEVVAKKVTHLRRLAMEHRLMGLAEDDLALLKKLEEVVPVGQTRLDEIAKQAREMKYYIGAAEGFLQIIEKDEEVLEQEGKAYLIDDVGRVGMIIISCMEKSRKWEELTDEEQSLIVAFSNIFEQASQLRAQKLILIEVQ